MIIEGTLTFFLDAYCYPELCMEGGHNFVYDFKQFDGKKIRITVEEI